MSDLTSPEIEPQIFRTDVFSQRATQLIDLNLLVENSANPARSIEEVKYEERREKTVAQMNV